MNPIDLLLFLPAIIGIVVLLGVLVYYSRKQSRIRQSFEELARRVQGTVSRKSMMLGDMINGQHKGIPFTCRYFMGSRNNPPFLTIQVGIPCSAKLTIRRKAWYDRFARQIGLITEIQTGDPVFDQTYFLDTDRMNIYQSLFSGAEKRHAVETLYGAGFPVREIVFGKKDLRIVLSPFPADALATVPIEKYLDALLNLSSGLSQVGYSEASFSYQFPSGSPRPPISGGGLVFLLALNGFFILGGLISLAYGMEQYRSLGHRLIVNALSVSVPMLLGYLIVVFRWIRGCSSSHRFLLFILISSLAGFPLAMTGGAVATNGYWDEGTETSRRVSVTDQYYHKNKSNLIYYVVFSSWRNPGQSERVTVDKEFFREVHQGDEIVIRTKPGYWQEEWIVGIQKTKEIKRRQDMPEGFPLGLRRIRFYEDGPSKMPGKDRLYAAQFAHETARYIYCVLDMDNNLWSQNDRLYTFDWQYINPDGNPVCKLSLLFTVRKEWKTAWVYNGWGWNDLGHWLPGSYRVVVLVDGLPFGEGTFTITTKP